MDKENHLRILTVNCQGLGESSKRKDVLNHPKAKNYNIYFIQDTHFVNTNENFRPSGSIQYFLILIDQIQEE